MKIQQKYKYIAQEYIKPLVKNKNIVGIILLAKPDMDENDDIDICVFADKNISVAKGEKIFRGYDIDTSIISYSYSEKMHWSQEMRAGFKNHIALYDTRNRIRKLLKKKLVFPVWEQKTMIISNLFHLTWMGIYDNHKWKDYKIPRYPHDTWLKRYGTDAEESIINYGTDLLLNMLYAYNKEFIPDERSKLYYSYELKYIPKNYRKRINNLMKIKKIDKNDFERRYKILTSLLRELIDRCKEKRILPKNIYHYYLKHGSFYSMHHEM